MNKLTNPNLNQRFNPLKLPPKAPQGGDVGWMVDCKVAELPKLANLGHYPPNIPTPWALLAPICARKIFFKL